jgi:hypothetical protein
VSCGAIGSWNYLARHKDETVAAAVLLSGEPGKPTDPTSAWAIAGCDLGKVALWDFHGNTDATLPIADEQATMANIIACPSPPRRDAIFTVITGGHIIWDPIYDLSGGNGDIYAWLLDHAKPDAAPHDGGSDGAVHVDRDAGHDAGRDAARD